MSKRYKARVEYAAYFAVEFEVEAEDDNDAYRQAKEMGAEMEVEPGEFELDSDMIVTVDEADAAADAASEEATP